MTNILEFKLKPRTAKIKPEDIDCFQIILKSGLRLNVGEKLRYNLHQFLLKNNLDEYYLDD